MDENHDSILHAEVVNRFVNDPEIQKIFAALDAVYWRRVKEANSPAESEQFIARARALGDLRNCMAAAIDVGRLDAEQIEAQRRQDLAETPPKGL